MPARSCPEWESGPGVDEPDTRHEDGMASGSPMRAGYVPARPPLARAASSRPLSQEPPWVDPPFDAYFPTIMGNLAVLDSGDGNNLYGIITARQLNATLIAGVAPSGDTTGATDTAAINAAVNAAAGGGVVRLGPGVFYVNAQITLPQQTAGSGTSGGNPVSLKGVKGATRIAAAAGFSGTVLYAHRQSGYGAQFGLSDQKPTGKIVDLTIDLASAGPGSIGLDVGDGWGYYVDVEIVNGTSMPTVSFSPIGNVFTMNSGSAPPAGFPVMLLTGSPATGFALGKVYYVVSPGGATFQLAATPGGAVVTGTFNAGTITINGCVGLYAVNRVFWSEKGWYRAQLKHNAIAAIIDTQVSGSDFSHEYNWFIFDGLFADTGQQGIVVASGSNLGGSRMYINGNMAATSSTGSAAPPGNIAMLTLTGTNQKNSDGSRFYQGQLWAKVEGNSGNGTGTVYPYGIYSDGAGYVKECTGAICHSLGNPNVTGQDSLLNGAEFSFSGPISGDSYLTGLQPTTGGSGLMSGGTAYNTNPTLTLGAAFKNTAPNQLVCIAGGTLTGISVNGQATGLTSGPFPIPAGATITVSGSVLPTTSNWVNLAQNAY